MKVHLVVATGVHAGKSIPVPGPQFIVGRDPSCHLRPASPAVSKRHTAIFAREGKLYVKDLGSTNGTFLNDEPVTSDREITHGDRLKIGPLDFTVQLTAGRKSDETPLPDALKVVNRSSEADKATDPAVRSALTTTPDPMRAVMSGPPTSPISKRDDPDQIAAMLLGMDEDDPSGNPPTVPEGSTVHEMPAVDFEKLAAEKKAENDRKQAAPPTAAETSATANEILKKYMQRKR